MAWQLVLETLDHAPRHLTSPERFLLVVLAEYTKDIRARECEQSTEDLAFRMGISVDGVRKILAKLARNRLDVRVPLGTDKRGAPVYAHRGQVPRYRLPAFPPPAGCPCRTCREGRTDQAPSGLEGGTDGPPSIHKGGTHGPPSIEKGGTPVVEGGTPVVEGGTDGAERRDGSPTPPVSGTPVLRSPRASEAATLAHEVGATEDEIDTLVEKITAERSDIASPVAWLRACHKRGDLAPMLAEIRSEQQRARIAAELERARRDRRMECEHGTPAGLYRRPDTGQSATCAQCRRAQPHQEVNHDAA